MSTINGKAGVAQQLATPGRHSIASHATQRTEAIAETTTPCYGLFGAAPDTSNLGVSALFAATVDGVTSRIPGSRIVAFDNGAGLRRIRHRVAAHDRIEEVVRFGCWGGRRYYRQENLATMTVASRIGSAGGALSTGVGLIDGCTAVLDISGGDSFSDIYGTARFLNIVRPKELAVRRGRPLLLLPQTYGPYRNPKWRGRAAAVVRQADVAWARDEDSFAVLRELLGDDFDPQRHRCGVDIAFGLRPRDPSEAAKQTLAGSGDGARGRPVVGFNVSGLIYQDLDAARGRFGFKADYRKVVHAFLTWLLKHRGVDLILVPHVLTPVGHYESDIGAAQQVLAALPAEVRGNARLGPVDLDQNEMKWVISMVDWFCGTRMHSTIAGLSSGVPTASITYSDKARGVFASCGQTAHALDPRVLSTGDLLDALKQSFDARAQTGQSLATHLPAVLSRADQQMQMITDHLAALAAR